MTVYLDQEVEGNGTYNFGGAQIQYMLCYLDILGPNVFVADTENPDILGRAGWVVLGSRDAYGTGVDTPFWNEKIWVNSQFFQWHPQPTVHPGDPPDLCVWASDVRWAFSPGTHGFLLVVGI